MTLAPDWVILALGVGGVFFSFVAAVGLLRLPDVYTRAHATSKSDTLGAMLAIGAAALALDAGTATVKAAFLLTFAFLTNPTAAHAVTRAALDQDIEPWTAEGSGIGRDADGAEPAASDPGTGPVAGDAPDPGEGVPESRSGADHDDEIDADSTGGDGA